MPDVLVLSPEVFKRDTPLGAWMATTGILEVQLDRRGVGLFIQAGTRLAEHSKGAVGR